LILSALFAVLLTALSTECFRVLQNASYRPQRGYCKVVLSWYYLSLVVLQTISIVFRAHVWWLIPSYLAVALTFNLIKRKSRLKYTKRIVRMIVVCAAITFVLCYFAGVVYFTAALPIIVLASWLICLPVDVLINKHYLKKARQKLINSGVEVIAVTGSYGKTSVKDCLSVLLEDSVSPSGSCNTPLGIAAFINKTDFYGCRFLILEFGARRKGDIKELSALFNPKYGIVTGVCPQHLSTFKTFENVIAAKRELVESIPPEGFCVLNEKDAQARGFAQSGECAKYFSRQDLSVECSRVDFDGSSVTVEYGGIKSDVLVPYISEYICDTLAMSIQTCIKLGQDISTTISRIVYLKQTKHRLEVSFNGKFYIVDDSYNANIIGAKSCARTLAKFNCSKAAISQGIVECGKEAEKLNEECGRLLGNVCDIVVVLGKNSQYLLNGLKDTSCSVYKAKTLDEAVEIVNGKLDGGILLFQNDLPDVVNV